MTLYRVVPATLAHVEALAGTMAQADRAEVWALDHLTPHAALLRGLLASRDTIVGLADEVPIAMFGVVAPALVSDEAMPWMLGAEALPQHWRWFLRRSVDITRATRAKYKRLANYVDARHTRSTTWLRWLGFTLRAPAPFGPDGLPFHRFEMEGL